MANSHTPCLEQIKTTFVATFDEIYSAKNAAPDDLIAISWALEAALQKVQQRLVSGDQFCGFTPEDDRNFGG